MSRALFERMLASRMLTQKDETGRMSRPIVRVAVAGIAIGIMVMILTLSVVQGFQAEIRKKVTGFGSHIQITPINNNNSLQTDSMRKNADMVENVKKIQGIRHVQPFAIKAGIIKSQEQLLGVVLKGVDKDFDWEFFQQNLVEGELFSIADTVGDRVLISRYMADKMELEVGKKFKMFFLSGNKTRPRVFYVAGIYSTGLTDGYDDKFVICDMRQVQALNNWDENTIAGYEVLVSDEVNIDDAEALGAVTDEVNGAIGLFHIAENIRDLTPTIFSWLDVLDTNAGIIIVLMIFVGMINMISALLIMIIDRTNMIGILKALGAKNWMLMRVFVRNGGRMILIGVLVGNFLGIGLCLLQQYTGLIGLDEASYYVSVVPVDIVWPHVIALNIFTVLICCSALLIPSLLVMKITPVRAIRFS